MGNDTELMATTFLGALPWARYALALAIGYGLGSIPSGYLLGRLAGIGDIRAIGSGNIGATNVLRTGRKGLAALTLLADAGKGLLAVLGARALLGEDEAMIAGLGAFLGHLFPVWLGFRGGKGVATYIGILVGLHLPAALVFCAIWLAVALATRYSSLSALIAAVFTPAFLFVTNSLPLAYFIGLLSVMIVAKHHRNIGNLISGRESKIGEQRT